jgi:hypothetical protein
MSRALSLLLKGRPWEKRAARFEYLGSIKAVEVTHGQNGWHPHTHAVLLFDRKLTDEEYRDLLQWICGRWSSIVQRKGFGSLSTTFGVDLRPIESAGDVASYVTKVQGGWGAGLELTRTDLKRNAPFDLLRSFLETGERAKLDLWLEFERATFGKRALVISRNVRARYLVDEVSDEELAKFEGADEMLLQALVPQRAWNSYVRGGAVASLLTDVEQVAASLLVMADVLGHVPNPLVREAAPPTEEPGPLRIRGSGGLGVSPSGANSEVDPKRVIRPLGAESTNPVPLHQPSTVLIE